MPDLEDQLRTYYEATTEPIDVDSVTVDPGTVIVGPFPEAAQRRSGMTAPTKPQETRPWWQNAWAAAAAFLIVVLVGGGILLATGNDDRPPVAAEPDTSTTVASTVADVPAEPTVVFDGSACTIQGPTSYPLGETISITLSNEADAAVSLAIWKVPEGTTQADIATGVFGDEPRPEGYRFYRILFSSLQPATSAQQDATLIEPGQHMLNCFVLDDDATDSTAASDFPAFVDVIDG